MFKAKQKKPEYNSPSIERGMEFKGDLELEDDITISGHVIGSVKAGGKVTIGEHGIIQGDLGCEETEILGTVEGTLVVEGLLTLHSKGKVIGDIYSEEVDFYEGCTVQGKVNIGTDWKEELESNGEQRQNKITQSQTQEEGQGNLDTGEDFEYPPFED